MFRTSAVNGCFLCECFSRFVRCATAECWNGYDDLVFVSKTSWKFISYLTWGMKHLSIRQKVKVVKLRVKKIYYRKKYSLLCGVFYFLKLWLRNFALSAPNIVENFDTWVHFPEIFLFNFKIRCFYFSKGMYVWVFGK